MYNTRDFNREDEANAGGGDLVLRLGKEAAAATWLHVALAAVGEQLSDGLRADDELCGITLSVRKNEVNTYICIYCSIVRT